MKICLLALISVASISQCFAEEGPFPIDAPNHQSSDFLASRTKTGNPDHTGQKNGGLHGPPIDFSA